MKAAPLGVFDSGVGGLTVVRALRQLLPSESIVYLGDTARLPYGSKSPDTIRRFAKEDCAFLLSRGVKAIVVACNTATAHALPDLQATLNVPVVGVIEPGVEAALADANAQRIGIIATQGTIRSHAYQHAIALRRPDVMILEQATPLLVPLVEEDWITHDATLSVLHTYLDPMLDRGMDTLLLACTHYPLLMPVLKTLLGDSVRLVDSATTCAEHVRRQLEAQDLTAGLSGKGKLSLCLTDLSEQFETLARRFLGSRLPRVERVAV
jgi:glutamate racemase